MDKSKIIALAAVLIIVIAAAAVLLTKDNGDDAKETDTSFTIVDDKGTEFKFDGPIDGVVSVNTNVPKAMKILGYEKQLKGISFYTSSSDTDKSNWELFQPLFPDSVHMSMTKSMTAEEIIQKTGVKYVIAPVSSMTVQDDKEAQYKAQGIQVIRLDCNGDTTFEDYEKLITLFQGKDAKNEKYEEYKEMANSVIDNVISKAKKVDTSDKTFFAYMNSKKAFYNQTSEVSKNIEMIYGKNATRNIDGLDLSGISNDATADGLKERIIALDAEKKVDKFFLRGLASTTTVAKAEKIWSESVIAKNYSDLSCVKSGEVYVFDSDFMSGPLSYIGIVLYAEICGIDTGYNPTTMVEDFNKKYGFNEETSGFVFKIADGKATELTFS